MKKRMFNRGMAALMSVFMLAGSVSAIYNPLNLQETQAATARQVEGLKRGLTVTGLSSGVMVNWRYLGTDSKSTVFKLYRDSSLVYTSNGRPSLFSSKLNSNKEK